MTADPAPTTGPIEPRRAGLTWFAALLITGGPAIAWCVHESRPVTTGVVLGLSTLAAFVATTVALIGVRRPKVAERRAAVALTLAVVVVRAYLGLAVGLGVIAGHAGRVAAGWATAILLGFAVLDSALLAAYVWLVNVPARGRYVRAPLARQLRGVPAAWARIDTWIERWIARPLRAMFGQRDGSGGETMTEPVHPPPVPVRRALIAWIVAISASIALTYPLASALMPGEGRIIGFGGAWLALLGAVGFVKSPRGLRYRHRGVLDGAFRTWIVLPYVVVPLLPRDITVHAALFVGDAVLSAYLALVVVLARSPEGGYRPIRWLGTWSGLWAPTDPEIAKRAPVAWQRAVRTWLLLWPAATALTMAWFAATHLTPSVLLCGPAIAYLVADGGLTGTREHPRARHRGSAAAVTVGVAVGLLAILLLGFPDYTSPTAQIVASEVMTTAGLALIVVVTNRPLGVPPQAGVETP